MLQDEATLLQRTERVMAEVTRVREHELARYWPGVWKRWAAAVVLSALTLASFGAGYAWTSRPYDAELESLRGRVELLDFVAQRVLTMTPSERRQFDGLMKGAAVRK
jgi:hypothetical protein